MNTYAKNRPLQQKSNPNVYLKLIESVYLDKKKEQRLNLPKIAATKESSHAKKTLIALVKRLEGYISVNENEVPNSLKQCLINLREHLNEQNVIMTRTLAQRSTAQQHFNNDSYQQFKTGEMPRKSQDTWGSRSQVMNVKRINLKKVENKQLFEKIRTIKLEQSQQIGNFTSVSDKEVIGLLKNRIKEKDNIIRQLHQHIQGLNGQLEEIKNTIVNKDQSYDVLVKQNENMATLNISYLQQLQFLEKRVHEEQQKKAYTEFQKLQIFKKQLNSIRDQSIYLRAKLQEREDELTALWQTYLSGSYKCIL